MTDTPDHPSEIPGVQPALTDAEWALATLHDVNVGVNSSGLLDFERRRHALAALCLYGTPEGFTQADVVNLRAHSESVRQATGWTDHWADSLADRIAALLPPKP